MIDGVVNKRQGSLPASAAQDKETEAQRLICREGTRIVDIYIYISEESRGGACQKTGVEALSQYKKSEYLRRGFFSLRSWNNGSLQTPSSG